MSRVITFSRNFPAYHPRKGEPTFFPEKLFNSLHRAAGVYFTNTYSLVDLNPDREKEAEAFWQTIQFNYDRLGFKGHTIRSGNRWKVGEKFSPRVWSGEPYKSKMIKIAPDIEVKKIWAFKIDRGRFWISNGSEYRPVLWSQLDTIANNDGLSTLSFMNWFQHPKAFNGQVICWDNSINY